MTKYASLLNAALDKEDYEQMVINVIRLLELQDSPLSPTSLQMRQKAALWLFKLGHEKAADEAMQQCLRMFRETGVSKAYKAALEGFITYHLNCDKPEKALAEAEEILNDKPEHMLSLVAKMLAMDRMGKKTEAKKIAKKIHSLEKNEQSPAYKAAVEILAEDLNLQHLDK